MHVSVCGLVISKNIYSTNIKRGTLFDKFTFYPNRVQQQPKNNTKTWKSKELAREEVRKEIKMKLEEERREKIFQNYLASRIQSSFLRDFHTQRY
jgi:hypothetical protein